MSVPGRRHNARMAQVDTTNPRTRAAARALIGEPDLQSDLELVSRLRLHIVGLYYAQIGHEWSSEGRRECDFLHHIDIVLSGRRQIVHGGKTLDLLPGRTYFLPASVPLERLSHEQCQVMFLRFRCEWLPGVDPLQDWPGVGPTDLGPCDVRKWRGWVRQSWRPDLNDLLELHAQLGVWLSHAFPNLRQLIRRHLDSHQRFSSVFELIERKLGADLRVVDMADTYGTTAHAFSRVFAAHTRMNPKEYLSRRLNQQAIELLVKTRMSIGEIADELRFPDQFAFSRFFRRLNAVSPTSYRSRFQARGE